MTLQFTLAGKGIALGAFMVTAAVHATSVAAQTPSTLPGPANLLRLPERFVPQSGPNSRPNPPSDPAPVAKLQSDLIGPRFLVKKVVIVGSTIYSQAQLFPLYSALLGREATLQDLNRVKEAITSKYRSDGYILSQAILTPQPLDDGVVRFQVVEGVISNVIVAGNYPDSRRLIAAMGQKLVHFGPLRAHELERYVLLVSDLPGAIATSTLRPSKIQRGGVELILTVNYRPVTATISADNRGSKAIGPIDLSGTVSFNSLLGLAEQTSVLGATTGNPHQLQYAAVHHSDVLNSEGLRLSVDAAYGHSRPSGAIAVLDARGITKLASIELADPVIRSRSQSLTLGIGLTLQDNRTNLLGQRFSNDRIRYLSARALYDFADEQAGGKYPAQNLVRAEIHQGIRIFRASAPGDPYLSRASGRGDATVIELDILRIQTLNNYASIAVEGAGQYSSSPLLPAQQFGLGGQRFGRGYEPSELLGDDGIALSVEPRIDLKMPNSSSGQVYAFYEVGGIWQKPSTFAPSYRQTLSSAGVGLRFTVLGHFNAYVEIAKPLTREVASRGNRTIRPFFGISKAF